jgi:hypothetical protein
MGHLTSCVMGGCNSELGPVVVRGEWRWLALADKLLRTEKNDVECDKVLRGRIGWCAVPFIGSR